MKTEKEKSKPLYIHTTQKSKDAFRKLKKELMCTSPVLLDKLIENYEAKK